jgi:hypothetical protein
MLVTGLLLAAGIGAVSQISANNFVGFPENTGKYFNV